jgi:uncharacterized membrane protein YhaH (DUF805 family)
MNVKINNNSKDIKSRFRELLIVHRGRINRMDYFAIFLLFQILSDLLEIKPHNIGLFILKITLWSILTYFNACIISKRLRDIGVSAWLCLPIIILSWMASYNTRALIMQGQFNEAYILMAIELVTLAFLCAWPGQKYDNQYGAYNPIGIGDQLEKVICQKLRFGKK